MKSIKKFQKALSKNYYPDFLIEEINGDTRLEEGYNIPVRYREKDFVEIDIDIIVKKSKDIRSELKELFNDAITELHLILSEKQPGEVDNFFKFLDKSFQKTLKTIEADIFIFDENSRFNSIIDIKDEAHSLEKLINSAKEELKCFSSYNQDSTNFPLYDLWYYNYRIKRLSFLPMSLYVIGASFIQELHKLKKEKFPEVISAEIKTPLSCNQVILLLEQMKVLSSEIFKDLSIPRQAKIVSQITGFHSKNLEANIRKLENKPSANGKSYQKDREKIDQILKQIIE